jgi:hypothetical protein
VSLLKLNRQIHLIEVLHVVIHVVATGCYDFGGPALVDRPHERCELVDQQVANDARRILLVSTPAMINEGVEGLRAKGTAPGVPIQHFTWDDALVDAVVVPLAGFGVAAVSGFTGTRLSDSSCGDHLECLAVLGVGHVLRAHLDDPIGVPRDIVEANAIG